MRLQPQSSRVCPLRAERRSSDRRNDADAWMQRVVGRHPALPRRRRSSGCGVRVSTNWSSGRPKFLGARVDFSGQRFCAVACNALASEPASAASGANVNRRAANHMALYDHSPVCQFPYSTSCFPAGGASIHCTAINETLREPFMHASDNLFSTSRAIPCHVRDPPAIRAVSNKGPGPDLRNRLDSVSISPSTRSACSTWAANQASGILPFASKADKSSPVRHARPRDLAVIRNLAGIPQPFHAAAPCAISRTSPSRAA